MIISHKNKNKKKQFILIDVKWRLLNHSLKLRKKNKLLLTPAIETLIRGKNSKVLLCLNHVEMSCVSIAFDKPFKRTIKLLNPICNVFNCK